MKKSILFALLMLPFLTYAQSSLDGLTMADLSGKMDKLGQEMEGLGSIMEKHGSEMEKYGRELEKTEGRSQKAQEQMEVLGKKMSELGKQMELLGEQMGQYGEKMGALHQQMVNWFFRELKSDGLIPSLDGSTRIIFDEKGLNVDGKQASDTHFKKYKSGLEKYWGKALKPDFLFFFKGSLSEEKGNVKTSGSFNTDL